MHEISREITLQAQREGTAQLFLENPILFSKKLLESRINQFLFPEKCKISTLFYDRSIVDVVAYLEYANIDFSKIFIESCCFYRYDRVFILPPWKEIYHSDNERYENFEQAVRIYEQLKNTYTNFGYKMLEVPLSHIEKRVEFVLESSIDLF